MSIRYPSYKAYRQYMRRVGRRKHEQMLAMRAILVGQKKIIESAFAVMESQAALIKEYADPRSETK